MKQQGKGGPGPTAKKIAAIGAIGKKRSPSSARELTRKIKTSTRVAKAVKRATTPRPSKKIGGR